MRVEENANGRADVKSRCTYARTDNALGGGRHRQLAVKRDVGQARLKIEPNCNSVQSIK
jgi:hypothetical protein